jgi:excisionase family DNA binding protein
MSEQQFDPQEWILTYEAADLANCTPQNLTRAARSGGIPYIRRGKIYFFKRDDVMDYIRRMNELGTAKHNPKYHPKARFQ